MVLLFHAALLLSITLALKFTVPSSDPDFLFKRYGLVNVDLIAAVCHAMKCQTRPQVDHLVGLLSRSSSPYAWIYKESCPAWVTEGRLRELGRALGSFGSHLAKYLIPADCLSSLDDSLLRWLPETFLFDDPLTKYIPDTDLTILKNQADLAIVKYNGILPNCAILQSRQSRGIPVGWHHIAPVCFRQQSISTADWQLAWLLSHDHQNMSLQDLTRWTVYLLLVFLDLSDRLIPADGIAANPIKARLAQIQQDSANVYVKQLAASAGSLWSMDGLAVFGLANNNRRLVISLPPLHSVLHMVTSDLDDEGSHPHWIMAVLLVYGRWAETWKNQQVKDIFFENVDRILPIQRLQWVRLFLVYGDDVLNFASPAIKSLVRSDEVLQELVLDDLVTGRLDKDLLHANRPFFWESFSLQKRLAALRLRMIQDSMYPSCAQQLFQQLASLYGCPDLTFTPNNLVQLFFLHLRQQDLLYPDPTHPGLWRFKLMDPQRMADLGMVLAITVIFEVPYPQNIDQLQIALLFDHLQVSDSSQVDIAFPEQSLTPAESDHPVKSIRYKHRLEYGIRSLAKALPPILSLSEIF